MREYCVVNTQNVGRIKERMCYDQVEFLKMVRGIRT